MTSTHATFRARGMHCHGCERVIEAGLRKLPGVARAHADYPTEMIEVEYDPALVDLAALHASVEENGYRVQTGATARRPLLQRVARVAAALALLAALILIDMRWIGDAGAPDISRRLDLSLIFLLGLVTGFHCIGMCGAFVVSYTAADARAGRGSWLSHLAFGAGKTLSYTTIGALFGALGAFIAFTPLLRGAAGVAAGLFLVVFGLNMLGLFAPLRRFRLGLPAPLERWVHAQAGGRHRPFVIGLLNGLMIACGPLQAMYVMAAGTGSAVEGGKMLFAFGLGTLPVMLAFGAVASMLSAALTHRLLKASGVLVLALGAVMINRGLILTGSGADLGSLLVRLQENCQEMRQETRQVAPSPAAAQTIEMEANRLGYKPDHFTLIAGAPVKWVINATEITSCNNRIVVPSLGLEFDLKPGLQTIVFTPKEKGIIPWSCWMGMIRGQFEVIEAGSAVVAPVPPPVAKETAPAPVEAAPQPVAPRAYRVERGDTLRRIAKKLYGDASRARDIAAANPGLRKGKLKAGHVLTLPAPAGP